MKELEARRAGAVKIRILATLLALVVGMLQASGCYLPEPRYMACTS